MKALICLIARLGSTRLQRKHLLEVCGKPILQWSIDRIHYAFRREIGKNGVRIVIATSDEKENRAFEGLKDCEVFYGSPDNIPLRLLQCAEHYDCDRVVSVDGDDILCSCAAMRKIYGHLLKGQEYVKTSGLPLGLNAAGYGRGFLRRCLKDQENKTLETGWGRIFDESAVLAVRMKCFDRPDLRFTLDYDCDFDFFSRIIGDWKEKLFRMSDAKLVRYVVSRNVFLLNKKVADEYWENFHKNVRQEKLKQG